MTSDIRSCEVCGKSYEQARRLLNDLLRSNIILPKIQSEKYHESLQKLLTEVKNFEEVIEKKDLPNYPLSHLLFRYGHHFDNDSTLYKFMSEDQDLYISKNELTWFEQYVKQVCGIDIGIGAEDALHDMQKWLETEIKERVGDPGGFSQSVNEVIEEATDKYVMHTKTVFLEIESGEKLPQLLSKWHGSDFLSVTTRDEGVKIEKAINVCWICSRLFIEASKGAYEVE